MFKPSDVRRSTVPLYRVNILGRNVRLTQPQVAAIAILASLLVYLVVRHPPLVAIGISAALTATGATLFPSIQEMLPKRRGLNWQYVTTTFLMIIMLAQAKPAGAQFFNSLEQATTEVVTGSNSGIDPAIVKIIFVLFRVLVVLAFVAGAIGMLVQMFRGGDWQPIATMIGIGLAFVIGVEVITTLMVGGTGGGGAPAGG